MPRNVPALALFTVIGCSIAMDSNAQVVKQDVEGIRNFAKIESTVACAGAISPAAIAEIKKMGYQAIINLRLASEQGADIEGAKLPRRRRASLTTTFHSAPRNRTRRRSTSS